MSFFSRSPKMAPKVTSGMSSHPGRQQAETRNDLAGYSAQQPVSKTDQEANIMPRMMMQLSQQLQELQQQMMDLSMAQSQIKPVNRYEAEDADTENGMDHLIAQALLKWEQHQQLTNPNWAKIEADLEQAFLQSLEEIPVFTPFEAIMLANNLLAQFSQSLDASQATEMPEASTQTPLKEEKTNLRTPSARKYHNHFPDQGAGRAHTPKPKTPRAAFEAALAKIESRQV